MMNQEQTQAFQAFCARKNILITGHAGTGKSYLISHFRKYCRCHNIHYGITSTTGVSSLLIYGTTLHSYLGLGTGSKSLHELIHFISKNHRLKYRYEHLQCLIIDEVSMLSGEMLQKIHYLFQHFRSNSHMPFGNLHVVLLGDFYQLPVVNSNEHFIFDIPLWKEFQFQCIHLHQSMRQTDPVWIELLNHIRIGQLTKEDICILKQCCKKKITNPSIIPTILYSTNKEVDQENIAQLQRLKKIYPVHTYEGIYHPNTDSVQKCFPPYFKKIELTLHTQVMFTINNIDEGYANGSRGVIVEFSKNDNHPIVELMDKKKIEVKPHLWQVEVDEHVYTLTQYPLKLAWCITIHKSQGMTLDCVKTDIGKNIFTYGQAYVALSRVRNLEGLYLTEFMESQVRANPLVTAFYSESI